MFLPEADALTELTFVPPDPAEVLPDINQTEDESEAHQKEESTILELSLVLLFIYICALFLCSMLYGMLNLH